MGSIIKINELTFVQVINKLSKHLGNLEKKQIGILGLTYKPGTSTLRRSPALKLINLLLKKKAQCMAYDPHADATELKQYSAFFRIAKDIRQLAKESDALVLVTEWPEFKNIAYEKIVHDMKKPILIDSKNFLDPLTIRRSGFIYEGYGR